MIHMNFYVCTLFPELIMQSCRYSIVGRAIMEERLSLTAICYRDFADENRKRRVDDYTYGGGAGMVIQPGPIVRSFRSIEDRLSPKHRVIYVTPQGRLFDEQLAIDLSHEDDVVFLCGHYEGVDERALDILGAECVSIGDYVLSGGELPALVMIDAIARRIPGVLHNDESADIESLSDGTLEYPQYTRPVEFEGLRVPEILLSGHHANIEKWRRGQSLLRTRQRRPDLFEKLELTKEDRKLLQAAEEEEALALD